MIIKKQEIPSDITLQDFGKAMAELDLKSIPPEKRDAALMDHLVHVMIGTMPPGDARDEMIVSWLARRKRF